MRKRLVIGVAVVVVAIGAGFAIKAGKGSGRRAGQRRAWRPTRRTRQASEVPLDFTAAEAAKPLTLALPQVVEFSGALVAPEHGHGARQGHRHAADAGRAGRPAREGRRAARAHRRRATSRATSPSATPTSPPSRPRSPRPQRTHESNIGLANDKFISPIALETSKSQLEQREGAGRRRRRPRSTPRRIALRDASLVAPISGIVSKRYVVAGEKVTAEQQVVTIVDLHLLELAGTVGTQEVARLSPGMPVDAAGSRASTSPSHGKLARIAPAAEAGTRSIGVAVQLHNPKETLRAGQYAVAQVQIGDATPRLTVPHRRDQLGLGPGVRVDGRGRQAAAPHRHHRPARPGARARRGARGPDAGRRRCSARASTTCARAPRRASSPSRPPPRPSRCRPPPRRRPR